MNKSLFCFSTGKKFTIFKNRKNFIVFQNILWDLKHEMVSSIHSIYRKRGKIQMLSSKYILTKLPLYSEKLVTLII